MSRYLRAPFADLTPYTPGEQLNDRRYIKLNTNESPYPPSPKVSRVYHILSLLNLTPTHLEWSASFFIFSYLQQTWEDCR